MIGVVARRPVAMQDPAAQHRRAGIPFPALPARIELRAVRMPRRHQRAIRQPQRPPVGGCRGQVGLHGVVVWNDLDFPVHQPQPGLPFPEVAAQVRDAMGRVVVPPARRTAAGQRGRISLPVPGRGRRRAGRAPRARGWSGRCRCCPAPHDHAAGTTASARRAPRWCSGASPIRRPGPRRWRRRNPSRRPVPRRAGSPARRRGSPRHSCREKLAALASADDEGGMRPLGAGQAKAASVERDHVHIAGLPLAV